MLIIETTLIHVLGCTYASFSGIYIIYMGSCWAVSHNIPASTSVFHVLGRIPRAPRRALGPSALRHVVSPSGFELERKKPRPRRAIL